MKRNFIYVVLLMTTALFCFAFQTNDIEDMCKSRDALQKSKAALKPYNYDLSEVTEITFEDKETVVDVEIPLFFGEKYRIIFNLEGLAQKVDIDIYNRKPSSKNRELLFSTKDKPANQKVFVFEPQKSRKMYLTYTIPAAAKKTRGCVVMVIGYEFR
jgi:DNA polymerase III delta subunit